MPSNSYVIRVVLTGEQTARYGIVVECMRYAGHVVIHRLNTDGMCFDILPCGKVPDSGRWADANAERIQTFGLNAVKAPAWKEGDDVIDR